MEKDAFLTEVKVGDPITADLFNRIIGALRRTDFDGGGNTHNGQSLVMAYMISTADAALGPAPSEFEIRYAQDRGQAGVDAIVDHDDYKQYAYNFYNQEVPVGAGKARLCWLTGSNALVVADCVEFDVELID